jgi:hypothetical protein
MDYTRLELDDDPEEDEISMRTQYLFNEETSITPKSRRRRRRRRPVHSLRRAGRSRSRSRLPPPE